MPLIRLQVRNEFGLGDPALYRSADGDDPKAVLDGVVVSGLVGILRQLGDLVEFAADVFRDILEQVAVTTSRSNKMRIRIQNIETNLTPIEKAAKAQKSHLHFAYTSGFDWHVKIRTKQQHLNRSDLPNFMVDSYEKCHGPPRLFLLDRFDSAGAGACLKRYSDPSYFKTVCMSSELTKAEGIEKEKRPRPRKRKGSRNKLGGASDAISIVGHHISDRLQFTPFVCEMTTSRSSVSSKLDHTNESLSYDSCEHILKSKSSFEPVEDEHGHLSTSETTINCMENHSCALEEELQASEDYNLKNGSLHGQGILRSSSVSWDEKTEIVTPITQKWDGVLDDWQLASGSMPASNMSKLDVISTSLGSLDQDDIVFDILNIPESFSRADHFSEVTSEKENCTEALKTLDSENEKEIVCQTEQEVELQFNIKAEGVETIDGLTHEMSDKEVVCHSKQEIELQYNMKTEGVAIIDGLTHQISDLFSDSLHMDSPNFSYSSLDRESSPASCPNMSEEKIHVEVTQPFPLALNTINLRVYGESSDFIGPSTSGGFETIADDLPSWSVPSYLEVPKIVDSLCESEKCLITSDVPAVTIWTNGGLLGLEPSKPPDFSESDAMKKNHQKPITAVVDKQPIKVEEATPSVSTGCCLATREQSQRNIELPSSFSGLSDKFFRNSQWVRASVTFHNESVPSTMEGTATTLKGDSSHITQEKRTSVIASEALHDVANKEKFDFPSPPLEHIRISFHSASETSKMKLEFLSGISERSQDIQLPSFHLLPEQAASLQANCSDSEDDTFCQSSQYLSDDALSPRSDMSSEQWEFRECNGNGDREIYDVLRSAPSSLSISGSWEFDVIGGPKLQTPCDVEKLNAENELQSIVSGSSLRSSGCSLLCSLTRQKDGIEGSLLEGRTYCMINCTCEMHSPPPLPPLQRRIIKPTPASEDQSRIPDTVNQQIDSHIFGSISLELCGAAVQQQDDVDNKDVTPNKIMLDQTQLDAEREVHQVTNGNNLL